eukprot:83239-Rhodomonas_salina.1
MQVCVDGHLARRVSRRVSRHRKCFAWILLILALLAVMAMPSSCKKKGKSKGKKASTVSGEYDATCAGGVCNSEDAPPYLVRSAALRLERRTGAIHSNASTDVTVGSWSVHPATEAGKSMESKESRARRVMEQGEDDGRETIKRLTLVPGTGTVRGVPRVLRGAWKPLDSPGF